VGWRKQENEKPDKWTWPTETFPATVGKQKKKSMRRPPNFVPRGRAGKTTQRRDKYPQIREAIGGKTFLRKANIQPIAAEGRRERSRAP